MVSVYMKIEKTYFHFHEIQLKFTMMHLMRVAYRFKTSRYHLPGKHNLSNILAAATAAEILAVQIPKERNNCFF